MGSLAVAVILLVVLGVMTALGEGATWCIARSEASAAALQSALDYACGAGRADCQPIQPSGLCYLPNTLPSHASYAFNSYYQRSSAAPGACDFAGTATVTVTDPSYGSCTYPSSASAGGTGTNMPNTTTPTNTPTSTTPGFGGVGGGFGGGLSPPGIGTTLPNIDASRNSALLPLLLCSCLALLPLL